MTHAPTVPSRAARYLGWGATTSLAIAGAAAFLLAGISYRSISHLIFGTAAAAPDMPRGADSLAANFPGILARLRVCSAAFLAAAAATVVWRREVREWTDAAVVPLPRLMVEAARRAIRALRRDGRLHLTMLATICVLAAALRARFLFDTVGFDEADTFVSYASRPLYIGLSWYPQPNNHVFHTLLLHLASRLFGDHEWVVRLPALCAGLALIPLTYLTARVFYHKQSALIAAAFVGCAPSLVYYSVTGRGYTLVCVFFMLLLLVSAQILEDDSPAGWLLWSLVAALGFYTIPTMLYAAAPCVVWLASSSRHFPPARRGPFRRRLAGALAVTGISTTVFYLPVLIASGPRPLFANGYVRPQTFSYLVEHIPENLARTWQFLTADVPGPLVAVIGVGLVAGLMSRTGSRNAGTEVLVAASLSIPALLLVQRVVPFPRVWLFLVPLFSIVSAAGLWRVGEVLAPVATPRGSRRAACLALTCFVVEAVFVLRGTSISTRAILPGMPGVAAWLKTNASSADVVLVELPATAPLAYYIQRQRVPLVSHPAPCDPMSVVLSANGWFRSWPARRSVRLLAVVADGPQTLNTVLASGCLGSQPESTFSPVYSGSTAHVFESRIDPASRHGDQLTNIR